MRSIDCAELKTRLEAGEQPLLLDVREPWEFDTASLDDSRNVPMSRIPMVLENWQFGGPDDEIVVICHHGVRSLQVARYLETSGFTNVVNLTGGIHTWAQQVDPRMPTY